MFISFLDNKFYFTAFISLHSSLVTEKLKIELNEHESAGFVSLNLKEKSNGKQIFIYPIPNPNS